MVRRHHFIGNFGEEAPFYWLFERGGAILLGKFGRRLVEFFYLCHTCRPTREMSIYTQFRHFLVPHTHIFHSFSTSSLNKLLDILILKYTHGLEKPKNYDKKARYPWYDLHIVFTIMFSLILRLATLIFGFRGWQVCLCPKLCWRLAGESFYGPRSTWRGA